MSIETEDAAARRASHVPAPGPEVVPPPASRIMPVDTSAPPAGWYPSPAPGAASGSEMYWDGATWHTAMTRGPVAPGPVAAEPVAAPVGADPIPAPVGMAPGTTLDAAPRGTAKKPWYRRRGIVIPVGVLAGVIVLSSIVNGITGDDDDTAAAPPSGLTDARDTAVVDQEEPEPAVVAVPNVVGMDGAAARAAIEGLGLTVELDGDETMPVTAQDVAEGVEVEEGTVIVLTLEEKPTLTLGQQNAIGSAESYLAYSGFSRAGLLQQLTSEYGEGYETADAEFAIAHLEQNGLVDWNAEAVESAESYLEYSEFSRDGLYDQLTSEYGEGFTPEQAEHALGQVGY